MSRLDAAVCEKLMAFVGVAAVAATVSVSSVAEAHPTGTSVAINFGASEPSGARSDVEGPAGVLETVQWNNLDLSSGGGEFDPVFLKADENGEAIDSDVTVEWATSGGTWASTGRGEENNTAPPGDDRNLMTGYLDTNADDPAVVTIGELDALTDAPYTVYVYINGGVTGRGGDYVIEDDNGMGEPIAVVDTEAFDGTYVEEENYIVFEEVEGLSFTLTATPTTGGTRRAPINAIEIVVGPTAPRMNARRDVTPETDAAACAPSGRGPLTVTISQPLAAGADAGEMVSVVETALGEFSGEAVDAQQGGVVQDDPDGGAQVTWEVSRQQLADGLVYTIDVLEGRVSFGGTVDASRILGDASITLACDTEGTNVSCQRNEMEGVDVTWENHAFADPTVSISLQVDGVRVATVDGSATSATIPAASLGDGLNRICVINSSEVPECCSFNTQPTGTRVAVNFGASEPSGARSDVEGPAGVLGTVQWNNLDLSSGGGEFDPVFLKADENGEAIDSDVTVEWATSGGTWASTGRGEENNTAPPGDDRNLMTGYLDTNADDPAVVTIGELDAVTDAPYTVYVYINGGVRGRGGDYVIEDDNGMGEPVAVVDTEFFDGTYVEGENYIVFEEVEGLSFTLTATPTTGGTRRAPINAIEIVVASTAPTGSDLLPGDVNGDGARNISDPVALLGYLFSPGDVLPACYKVLDSDPVELSEQGKKVADFNGDGSVNLSDAVADLNHQFAGAPPHHLGSACLPIAPGGCTDLCQR